MALELAVRYPERVARMVLVNPVGLYLADAPIAEMFGRSPAELAEMLFVDQEHPIAAAMHAMEEFTGDVGQERRDPDRARAPDVEGARRDRAARLGPVPARPEAAAPAPPHHGADPRGGRAPRTGSSRCSTRRR